MFYIALFLGLLLLGKLLSVLFINKKDVMDKKVYSIPVMSSSSDDTYLVEFSFWNNLTSISCNCPAGDSMMMCKHRTALLEGKFKGLCNPDDQKAVEEALALIDKDRYNALYQKYSSLEKQAYEIKEQMKEEKKRIGIKINTGF